MALFIVAFVASLIPFTAIYLWLRNAIRKDLGYRKICDRSLIHGVLCTFQIVLFSLICNILLGLTGLKNSNPLLYQALYTFIVLALMEETVKFITFRKILKKTDYRYSLLDVVTIMTIVGIGFGMIESVIYAIGASIPVVLVRGICVPHAGYGFLVGYFYAKGLKTGNNKHKMTGFILAWLLHGMYDFSLSEEFIAINENLMYIALLLAVLGIALAIWLIVFTNKARKDEAYMKPLTEMT